MRNKTCVDMENRETRSCLGSKGFHGAMIQSVMPWIGVVGKILTGKPHDYFMGKSLWFPVKIFPTKPIH